MVLILQEDPDGYRTLNDCHRVWRDGRIEQLGWPQVDIRYASGTRVPTGASITCTTPDGKPLQLEVESLLPVPIHVGGGYGGDPDWIHGQWKGPGFTERVTYDLTDESVAGRIMFGVIDHAARATLDGAEGLRALRARRPRPARPQRLRRLVHPRSLTDPTRRTSRDPGPQHPVHRRIVGRPHGQRHDRGRLAAHRGGRRPGPGGDARGHRRRGGRRATCLRLGPVAADEPRGAHRGGAELLEPLRRQAR